MNQEIFYFFYNLAHKSVVFDNIIIFTAAVLPWIVILLAGIFLIFHHEVLKSENPIRDFLQKKGEIFTAFFSGLTAYVLAVILKILINAPRPFVFSQEVKSLFLMHDYSFPSGHATFFMALAVSLCFYHKKAGIIFIILAILIGLSRIASGVHYPVDIVSGWGLGIIIGYLFMKIFKR